ncbi:LLM class flavin-dependent oxidoreductase [Microbacterium album]|uniref:5,10-methylenetetrahydromethanopterin reductase n=1 Tax=Microbacterium album TaxID=2053191 RepID=A0A917IEY4_9MICO|nr:LLM class flavin-dependent oxidoreductase [Microbacterium album]GGH43064.1 5,10-methylenetetrahydromethanopterin reductase [Microbacterium album]
MTDDGELTFSIRGVADIETHGRAGLTELTQLVESAGFDMIWSGNDFLSGGGLATLTAMLWVSERLKVASGVLDPVTLHPGQIAQFASGLQWLSDDRFILGLGAGSEEFFKWASIPHDKPVPRTRSALLAIRALTEGRDLSTESRAGGPWLPTARLHHPRAVPIYVGAMGPRMLEMAGRYADGVIALALPPRYVFEVVKHVRRGADAAGRDMADIDVAAGVWCGVSERPEDARAGLRRHIALMSGSLSVDALLSSGLDPEEFAHVQSLLDSGREDDAIAAVTPGMMELAFVGGPNEVIDQCAPLVAAGVRHISFGMPGVAQKAEAIRLLGHKVIPELRRMAAE